MKIAVLGTGMVGRALADRLAADHGAARRRQPARLLQRDAPTLSVCNDDSLGEQIQRALPQARVVKSLNTMNADLMVNPAKAAGSVFVCGEDDAAKQAVTELLTALGHTDVIDLGGIQAARGVEMYLPLWLSLMGALGTAEFNISVVR